MLVDPAKLPTHIAQVARRLNITGPDASADTFLAISYLAETSIKSLGLVLRTGLLRSAPEHAYRLGYQFVRADGLGVWDAAVREVTSQPLAGYLSPEFHPLLSWATQRRSKPEDQWFRDAKASLDRVLELLGLEVDRGARAASSRDLVTALVLIRNKTKAHGALGREFFAEANLPYLQAVRGLLETCPAFAWNWMHLTRREKGTVRGVLLAGDSPRYMKDAEVDGLELSHDGIYFLPLGTRRPILCGELLRTDLECRDFLVPNGGFGDSGDAEFLSYATGIAQRLSAREFHGPPVPPPASETEGLPSLDVQSNVFGNLPLVPSGYVERLGLQEQLLVRLLDTNHHIVTLHGRGGVGKTSLALFVCHTLAAKEDPPFEYIIWMSARDVDLRVTGPLAVRPRVASLEDLARHFGTIFSAPTTLEGFARVLESPSLNGGKGILFVFDNFETLADPTGIHRFLDAHAHIPNKVLITSRERAFKADYPIEVRGMEPEESRLLLRSAGRDLGIEGLLTNEVIESIYTYTEGHAYVMRVVLGEIAKERRYVPPKQLMARRVDIVEAVFERSFNKLSEAARRVFLTISNWRSAVSELALVVALGQRDLAVEHGLEECLRFSLILEDDLGDGQRCYRAPQLARVFGRKKLEGDPDRLVIAEDLDTVRRFGVLEVGRADAEAQELQINRFVDWCFSEAKGADDDRLAQLDGLLAAVAELWPKGWVSLARFRKMRTGDLEGVAYALRRAVEECPYDKDAWLERARFADSVGDQATHVAALIGAVEAEPSNVDLVRETAVQVTRYVNDRKHEIPKERRGVYLASVRAHMEKLAGVLDATGLSRLAWLFLLEGDKVSARRYAQAGLERERSNDYCTRILEKLG